MTQEAKSGNRSAGRVRRQKYYKVLSNCSFILEDFSLENPTTVAKDNVGLRPRVAWPEGIGNLAKPPWRWPELLEQPRLTLSKRFVRRQWDFIFASSVFYLSRRAKEIFESISPEACEFIECKTRIHGSDEEAPVYFALNVKAGLIDAIDFENSIVSPYSDTINGRFYSSGLDTGCIQLKADLVGEHHLFRLKEKFSNVYCDDFFKRKCQETKIKGLKFFQIDQRDAEGKLKPGFSRWGAI